MFDGRFRHAVDGVTSPIGRALASVGVTADVLTAAGLAMSVGSAVAIGAGDFALGLALMVATGLPDLLDGPVAKAAGTASVRGAFLDSVADRISDAFLYGGLAWYLAARHHGTAAVIPFAIVAVTALISYERAKAELLGLAARGGLMERAERFIALGAVLIVAAVDAALLAPLLAVFLVLVTATACGRFVRVWRAATAHVAAAAAPAAVATGIDAAAEPVAAGSAAGAVAAGSGAGAGAVAAGSAAGAVAAGSAAEPVTAGSAAGPVAAGAPVAMRWRRGRVDSRWRAWRAARARPAGQRQRHPGSHMPAIIGRSAPERRSAPVQRRSGEPWGRWRARRAGLPVSRVGGARRGRRAARAGARRTGTGSR